MSFILNSKKQILYPSFLSRLISLMIDFIIINIISYPLIEYIKFYSFKKYFGEFAENQGLKIETAEDVKTVVSEYSAYIIQNDITTYAEPIKYVLWFNFASFVVSAIYFAIFWSRYGFTPGKYALEHRVLNYETGERLSFFAALMRFICYIFFPISIFFALMRKDGRAIHDLVSGSVIIKK